MIDYCSKCGSREMKHTTGGSVCLNCGWTDDYEYVLEDE